MIEATQRTAAETPKVKAKPAPNSARPEAAKTENLEALAFKVPPTFRKRFRQRAVVADLKLNELLFEAFAAWEEKRGLKE
jgi:hypothetical protein